MLHCTFVHALVDWCTTLLFWARLIFVVKEFDLVQLLPGGGDRGTGQGGTDDRNSAHRGSRHGCSGSTCQLLGKPVAKSSGGREPRVAASLLDF